jgi:F-type H+-transporting ATPase subunit b
MPEAQTMPFVSIDWTIVFMLCNTFILFLIVSKFLFKPVKKFIDERQKELEKIYSDAEQTTIEANKLKDEYTQHMNNTKEEANEIIKSAYKKAQLRSEEILKEAQQKANAITEKANKDIEIEKKRAMNEIKNDISDIAIMIASKVVEKDIDDKDHQRLIEEFIDSVGDAR